jgi:DNA-binding Xre family transcriptional regulator
VKSKTNPHIGSNFDDFLREEGIYEEVEAAALKKVIASALTRQMKRRNVTVSKLADALGTSRAAINRVLDQENASITLNTLSRTAAALGCKVKLEIVAA